MTKDISNIYLMSPLHRSEFIWIKLTDIPDKVIKEYKLREIATKNGSIYIRAKTRLVQPPSSRTFGQQTPQKTPQQTQMPIKQIGTWPMEARHKTHTVHTGC
jgi:hypothetical protein